MAERNMCSVGTRDTVVPPGSKSRSRANGSRRIPAVPCRVEYTGKAPLVRRRTFPAILAGNRLRGLVLVHRHEHVAPRLNPKPWSRRISQTHTR